MKVSMSVMGSMCCLVTVHDEHIIWSWMMQHTASCRWPSKLNISIPEFLYWLLFVCSFILLSLGGSQSPLSLTYCDTVLYSCCMGWPVYCLVCAVKEAHMYTLHIKISISWLALHTIGCGWQPRCQGQWAVCVWPGPEDSHHQCKKCTSWISFNYCRAG